jgi:hypothetical protein
MDKEWKFQIGGSSKDTSLDLASRPTQNPDPANRILARFISSFSIITFLYFVYVWIDYKENYNFLYLLIDSCTWLIHEIGHTLFSPFGKFLYVLGGTITQIAAPLFVSVYLYKKRALMFASYSLFFLGNSILDVARYASDAQARALPLTGLTLGNLTPESHDWHTIFSMLNVLPNTTTISFSIYGVGWLVMVCAVFFCCKYAYAPLEANRS